MPVVLEAYKNAPTISSPSTAWTTLSGALAAGATSLTVTSAANFPVAAQFRLAIDDELLLVTAIAGTTFTVTRGIEGTTDASHASGASVFLTLTAASLARLPRSMTTTGDLEYLASTGAPARLAAGADGTYLRYASGLPTASAILLADLPSGVGLTASPLSQFAATTSAQLASVLSDETGSGLAVFNNTPTLIAPLLGTPTSGLLTNCTGLPLASVTGLGANVGTWLGTPSSANLAAALTDETGTGAAVFANTPTLVSPILGTPTSGTLSACTGLPISTGVSGLGTGVATFLGTPSSANLAAALTDETGSGAAVFATSPTLVTPILGIPTSGTLTSCTGLPLTTGVTGVLPVANGGTNASSASITAFNNITGLSAAGTTGTTSTNLVFSTSPTFITPTLGAATATTLNGLTVSTTTGTFTLTNGKTFAVTHGLTLAGTDSTTMTFPTTSATIARTDAAQTFTGSQTIAALVGPVTITEAVGSSGLTITGATQTGAASVPALNLTQTFNNSATTFIGALVNVTNTASASASTAFTVQIAGNSKFSVRVDGTSLFVGSISVTSGNVTCAQAVTAGSGNTIGFTSGSQWQNDTTVDTISQRRGTNPQRYNIGATFTSASVREDLSLYVASSVGHIGMTHTGSTARVLQLDYGGTTTAAISIPITSGAVTIDTLTVTNALTASSTIAANGHVTMGDAINIVLNTGTGTKIGTGTTQKLAFYNSVPVVQPTRGATLTNSVTSGGTDDTIADFTDLTIYANSAAAIRNDIYQLARIVRMHDVALRALGLES